MACFITSKADGKQAVKRSGFFGSIAHSRRCALTEKWLYPARFGIIVRNREFFLGKPA
jgi:hypothetical protein